MKNGKRPNKRQKMLIAAVLLCPDDWLVCKDTPTEMHIVSRYTNTLIIIVKGLYNHE